MHGFLVSMVSLIAEDGLWSMQLSHCGTQVSCYMVCGICPDQGLNLCPLHWQADSYPLLHQGSPDNAISFLKQRDNQYRIEDSDYL